MISSLKVWAAALGVGIALLVASWFGGRNSGQAGIKLDTAEKNLSDALAARDIENEVEALSPDALRDRSRKWVRKGNQ